MYFWCPRHVLLVVAFFFAVSLSAQDKDCTHRTISLVSLDGTGGTVRGLSPLDLRAKLHADDPQVVSVRPDRRPHKIILLIDISSSMSGESGGRENKTVWDIASHVVLSQLPNTSLALLTFDGEIRDRVEFSAENQAVVKFLAQRAKITPNGKPKNKTAIYDSILQAIKLFDSAATANSILLISDGLDGNSHANVTDTARALDSQGVNLHVVLLTPESQRQHSAMTVEEVQANDALRNLVADTGGLIYGPLGKILPTPRAGLVAGVSYDFSDTEKQELSEGLAKFYSGILNDQLVELRIANPDKKWRTLTLALSRDKSASAKDVSLAYPRQFPACP
jgi:hypothetical protein